MDIALLKKMHSFPADVDLVGLIPEASRQHSTLIEADISCFHDAPPAIETATEENSPELSDYELGFHQGQEKSAAIFQDTIKVMQEALDRLQSELTTIAQQIEAGHLSALAECLRAVFPVLMRGGTDLELQRVLQNACGASLKGKIYLYVYPDDKAHCQQLCEGKDIEIVADASLAPLQMRLKWENGGADIDCQSVATLCLGHLDTALAQ